MKQSIVSDGSYRLATNNDFRLRRAALWRAISEKYARELAAANPLARYAAWYRARREFNREWAKLSPSPGSLFSRAP
jgi:hypothetical protein